MNAVLLVAAGAALGAPARYLTDRAVAAWWAPSWPYATLLVNVVASFVLAVLVAAAVDPRMLTTVGTGFCGALSTYSTFSYETLRLAEDGSTWRASANVAVSVTAALIAAALGWAVGVGLR